MKIPDENGGCCADFVEYRDVAIENIEYSPYQPRHDLADEDIEALAASIRSVGIIQPPVVRAIDGTDRYELIAGERRLRAAKRAGYTVVSVMVRRWEEETSAEAALIENIQRVDLNPIDVARAVRRLIEMFGFSQEELAKQIGKKRSTVSNYLRLLNLPETIQQSLVRRDITMGHAKALLSLENESHQLQLHETIVKEGLTVRCTENMATDRAEDKKQPVSIAAQRDPHVDDLERRLQHHFGTMVALSDRGGRGTIAIDYYTLDDLERLLDIFGLSENAAAMV